jgi:hypothetical protein
MDDAKKNLLAEDNSILSLLLKFRLEREVCKLPTGVNRKKATDLIQKKILNLFQQIRYYRWFQD